MLTSGEGGGVAKREGDKAWRVQHDKHGKFQCLVIGSSHSSISIFRRKDLTSNKRFRNTEAFHVAVT
jgi:hypothetical protein